MMTVDQECAAVLTNLGLTTLEAQIYVFLLQHSPATGYRVAKEIGRSFPSTYKALASLQAKGAVLVDDGATRLSRAVPVDELMAQLDRRFREHRLTASTTLDRLPKSPVDNRIYQLTSSDQVYERARKMLVECQQRALLELFPEPLAALKEPIEETAARGMDVTARIYESGTIRGVRIVRSPYGAENLRTFRTQWLSVLIDGRQFLLAHLFTRGGGVYSATWSANPAVSRALYDYANSDFHHYAFHPFLQTARSVEELRAEYHRLREAFPAGGDLGFKDYLEEFALAPTEAVDEGGSAGAADR
jgi:sugar-specific transcriptional regulator TrmB